MDRIGDESEERGPTQAFDELRAEVAALPGKIELVYRQGQGARNPDYSATLGMIAGSLKTVEARLGALEAKQSRETIGTVYLDGEPGDVMAAVADLDLARHELKGLVGTARELREQQRWLGTVGFVGVITGLLLWVLLPALLPQPAGDWLVARSLGGSRWEAGQALMSRYDPVTYGRMARLSNACGEQLTEL